MSVAMSCGQPGEVRAGDPVAIALSPDVGLGLACGSARWFVDDGDAVQAISELLESTRPRLVWWGRETADQLAAGGLEIDRCWDVQVVHRFLFGGWNAPLGEVWAALRALPLDTLPRMGQLGLLEAPPSEGDRSEPLMPNGHLRPEWISGGFGESPQRLTAWAGLALEAMELQTQWLGSLPDPGRATSTARSESAAELLCAEMSEAGLPVDEHTLLELIADAAGSRPRSPAHEDQIRARRDDAVLSRLTPRREVNLRSPAEVKVMLELEGLDLPDTRAWRLERLRETEPLIEALLSWRRDERIATTYGYHWLDQHVSGGRLRGEWSSSDGAAGRMTASAGLHNLPASMRRAVAAESGHLFVRADLGQIEPRVLAAVSGDAALVGATQGDDLYLPVAERLGVDREIAKLAVLGAMYGATTGQSAGALAGLTESFPVAMELLESAAEAGRRSQDIFTSGGRRVRMSGGSPANGDLDGAVAAAAARGRYARNALVQGAAAEFFKVWAITVRRRARAMGASVVLCLHDELLVHVAADRASEAADMVAACVDEAAHYWSPCPDVRFVADVSIVSRWSEAK